MPSQLILAVPPSEYWAAATKEAAAQIDYETVHGPGAVDPSLAIAPVEEAAPDLASADLEDPRTIAAIDEEYAEVEEEEQQPAEAPKKARHVIAAVAVPVVKGSPGKGNAELTAAMRRTLREAGLPVINAPREDALTIRGTVRLERAAGQTQKVGLSWNVFSPNGDLLGAIKQTNDIPSGSLDKGWGDTAAYAAEAAASGIFDLVKKFR